MERLGTMPVTLEDVTSRIFQGLQTGADKVYIVHERGRAGGLLRIPSPQTEAEHVVEPDLFHPLVKGGDSAAYHLSRTDRLILFPYEPRPDGRTALIPEDELAERFPRTWGYLNANRETLEAREHGKMGGLGWQAYSRNQALDVMPLPKLFTPDLAPRAAFSLDPTGDVFFT